MADIPLGERPDRSRKEWSQKLAPYRKSSDLRAAWEIGITVVLFAVMWFGMYQSLRGPYVFTLALAVPTGLLLSRMFALQHEMGHRSQFKTRWLNDVVGSLLGVITITPYFYWRRTHAYHHATSGNLDERKFGDIDTWTVQEYRDASWIQRLGYRLLRHPLVLLTFGAAFQFGLKQRWPWNIPPHWRKEWRSVHATNLALCLAVIGMGQWVGYREFFSIQLPILSVAAPVGVWLFYMQHQYEEAYWERKANWSYVKAALVGSSFYDLPVWLHWFTANIGYHHIHHLDSAIPSYHLRRCMEENQELQAPVRFSLWQSFQCGRWRLWDEESQRMVSSSAFLREDAHFPSPLPPAAV